MPKIDFKEKKTRNPKNRYSQFWKNEWIDFFVQNGAALFLKTICKNSPWIEDVSGISVYLG